jgi:hypothetical protein
MEILTEGQQQLAYLSVPNSLLLVFQHFIDHYHDQEEEALDEHAREHYQQWQETAEPGDEYVVSENDHSLDPIEPRFEVVKVTENQYGKFYHLTFPTIACAMAFGLEWSKAMQPTPVDDTKLEELDIPRIKKAFKTVRFQDRVSLCDELGVHFAYLEAVLNQPGEQQSTFAPGVFKQLVERAITRWPGLAQQMGLPERATRAMCTVPPAGWQCSREAGHEGPCAARRVHVSGQALTLLTDNVPSFFDGDGCHGADLAIGFAMPDGRKILLPDLEPEEISEIVEQVNAAPGLLARLRAAEAPRTLTEREQQAVDNMNEALSKEDSGQAWADCGEVDAEVLLSLVARLTKPNAEVAK